MNKDSASLTRREALLSVIQGTVVVSLSAPLVSNATERAMIREPEFELENDYPYFGWQPVGQILGE